MPSPEISPVLFLSTAHLQKATAQLMEDTGRISRHSTGKDAIPEGHPLEHVSFSCIEYGYLVWAEGDADTVELYPADIRAAVEWAQAHGCRYIIFDCDGPKDERLPTYDW